MSKWVLAILSVVCMTLPWQACTAQAPASSQSDADLDAFVESLDFVFVTDLVGPSSAIVLTSNIDFMKMQGDTVQFNLPYMGTSHVATMGGGRGGLRFTGKATKIRTHKNKRQKSFELNFNVRNKGESFTCNLRVFRKGRAILTISSSQRSNAQYEGFIRPVPPTTEGTSGN